MKRRIGTLKGKPIVEGDKNLVKDIEYKDKFSKANRVVKQAVEQLNPDNSTNKTFTIPDNLINKENIESIIRNLNKFIK